MFHQSDFRLSCEWVESAREIGDHALVLERWATLQSIFHNEPDLYRYWIRDLIKVNDLATAEKLGNQALDLFPQHEEVVLCCGEVATRCGEYNLAAQLYLRAYNINSDRLIVATFYIESLIRLGRLHDAFIVVKNTMERWPEEYRLAQWRLELGLSINDIDEVLSFWTEISASHSYSVKQISNLAIGLIRKKPPNDILFSAIDFLLLDQDDGRRDWVPYCASFGDYFMMSGDHYGRILRDRIIRHIKGKDLGTPSLPFLVWKSLVGIPFTDEEIEFSLENCLCKGRMAIIATLFADWTFYFEPTSKELIVQLTDRFVLNKICNKNLDPFDEPLLILSLLAFTSIMSLNSFRVIQTWMAERPSSASHSVLPNLYTPSGALQAIVESWRPDLLTSGVTNSFAIVHNVEGPLDIAICVSGQLRGFAEAFPTWLQLGLQDRKVSTFVHTWHDSGQNWVRTWSFLRGYPALWEAVVAPNGMEFLRRNFPRLGEAVNTAIDRGANVSEQSIKDVYKTDHVIVESDKTSQWIGKTNVCKMHYKIEQAHSLAIKHVDKKTLFIKMRPDQAVGNCDPIDWDRVYFESIQNRMLYADLPAMFIGCNGIMKMPDAFVAGSFEPISVFSNTYSTQMQLNASGHTFFDAPEALTSHVSVAYSCFYRGVSARRLSGAQFDGFLNPIVISPADVLRLLIMDIGPNPDKPLEKEFIEACQKAL